MISLEQQHLLITTRPDLPITPTEMRMRTWKACSLIRGKLLFDFKYHGLKKGDPGFYLLESESIDILLLLKSYLND